MKKFLLILALVFLWCGSAWAVGTGVYYVDKRCAKSGDGSANGWTVGDLWDGTGTEPTWCAADYGAAGPFSGYSAAGTWRGGLYSAMFETSGNAEPDGNGDVYIYLIDESGPYTCPSNTNVEGYDCGSRLGFKFRHGGGAGSLLTLDMRGNTIDGQLIINTVGDGEDTWENSAAAGYWYYDADLGYEITSAEIGGDWTDDSTNIGTAAEDEWVENKWKWVTAGAPNAMGDIVAFDTIYVLPGTDIDPDTSGIDVFVLSASITPASVISRDTSVGTYLEKLIIKDGTVLGGATQSILLSDIVNVDVLNVTLRHSGDFGIESPNEAVDNGARIININYNRFINSGHKAINFNYDSATTPSITANVYNNYCRSAHLFLQVLTNMTASTLNIKNNATEDLYAGAIYLTVDTLTVAEDYNQWDIDHQSNHVEHNIGYDIVATQKWHNDRTYPYGTHDLPSPASITYTNDCTIDEDAGGTLATATECGVDGNFDSSGRPAVNSVTAYTGTDVSLTSDFDGKPIRGATPNIGAYESWPGIF